jgi:shikimate kinase
MLLFLVGYAGCGKSSLGKRLARRLGKRYVDTDKLVERSEGAMVADIFYYQGEEYFRAAERALIEELGTADGDMVISTGGGAPAWEDNMERMNTLGDTVYLRRTAVQIASRLSPHGRQKRPKLRGLNDEELVAFMTANMAEREPFYSKAKHCIDCAQMSDAEIIEHILQIVKQNE